MSCDEKKEQLGEWLRDIQPWGSSIEEANKEYFRFTEREDGRGSVILCTEAHTYHLSFTDDYLGAMACTRTYRAGEDWTRGNDLPDGKFTREVFDRIIHAMLVYELVELAPVREPVEVA